MKQKLLLWLVILLTGITTSLHAQVKDRSGLDIPGQRLPEGTNKAALEEIQKRELARIEALKKRLDELVKIPEWKDKYGKHYTDGKLYNIIDLLPDGSPLMVSPNSNVGAARTTRANRLWTGGSLGLNLNGEGITFGVWEAFDNTPEGHQVAAVLPTHQELNGRVTIMDGATLSPVGRGSNHATHVAGTLAATGIVPEAKGMASAAQIHSYDVTNHVAEMATASANGMRISQHSYGAYIITHVPKEWGGYYDIFARWWDEVANNALTT
ncbi:S8 family serine peptidase [Rhodoflexus caldus]|uniref:S8 family serine peptidase n=1 Tax=Rhodoflexus caldus TaxID=2891236 RepID=UPI002029CFE1|nr:S8 family serine peptidase [Rhodoflexus caldus]